MEKILFDTDIGSDIDDAICLAYLLRQPQCRLMGITTVSGEPVKRAMMASILCKAAGRDIPIYPGAENPLLIPNGQSTAPQSVLLEKWPHEKQFPQHEAIAFMRKTIRDNPNEITLLAVGPMTNVALLFATDPEIPGLLKQLVLMCGSFTTQLPGAPRSEWNAKIDPHATAIMYQAPVKISKSVGLDVTMQVTLGKDEVTQRFSHPLLQPVLDFAGIWFQWGDRITFHDPLAGTTLFDDKICGFETGNISVELESSRLAGLTYWERGEEGRHQAALTVDRDRFFEHYFSVF